MRRPSRDGFFKDDFMASSTVHVPTNTNLKNSISLIWFEDYYANIKTWIISSPTQNRWNRKTVFFKISETNAISVNLVVNKRIFQ